MQVTEGLAIDAAIALSKAGAAGLALGELAHALWPDAGVRANGACGSVVAELQRRGVATITPGGKRRRVALTDAGRTWIETASVIADAADAAELLDSYTSRLAPPAPPQPQPSRTMPAHVVAILDEFMALPAISHVSDAARDAFMVRRCEEANRSLWATCAGDRALFAAAVTEGTRRMQAEIDRIRVSLHGGMGRATAGGAPVFY